MTPIRVYQDQDTINLPTQNYGELPCRINKGDSLLNILALLGQLYTNAVSAVSYQSTKHQEFEDLAVKNAIASLIVPLSRVIICLVQDVMRVIANSTMVMLDHGHKLLRV